MPDEVIVNVEGETPPAEVVVAAPESPADPATLLREVLEMNKAMVHELAAARAENVALLSRFEALETEVRAARDQASTAEAVAAAAADLAVQAATETEEGEEEEEEEEEEVEVNAETAIIPVVETPAESGEAVAVETAVESAPETRSARRRYFI